MTDAGWTRDKEVEPAIDELKAQVQKIYNAGYQQGRVAGLKEASKLADEYGAEEWSNTCVQDAMARLSLRIDKRIEQAERYEEEE